jgi:lysozyme
MNMDDMLRNQLIRHEGLRLTPYRCTAGKLTIGVGRNLDDNGISRDEAMTMLDNDIFASTQELYTRFPITLEMDHVRTLCLVNMLFNLGSSRLAKFKKMWAAIEQQDWEEAANQMLDSMWADQVGRRAVELADQMRTGEFQL